MLPEFELEWGHAELGAPSCPAKWHVQLLAALFRESRGARGQPEVRGGVGEIDHHLAESGHRHRKRRAAGLKIRVAAH
jgi:hypothetical protein